MTSNSNTVEHRSHQHSTGTSNRVQHLQHVSLHPLPPSSEIIPASVICSVSRPLAPSARRITHSACQSTWRLVIIDLGVFSPPVSANKNLACPEQRHSPSHIPSRYRLPCDISRFFSRHLTAPRLEAASKSEDEPAIGEQTVGDPGISASDYCSRAP